MLLQQESGPLSKAALIMLRTLLKRDLTLVQIQLDMLESTSCWLALLSDRMILDSELFLTDISRFLTRGRLTTHSTE